MSVGAVLLLYSLFGYVVLPRIIRSQVEATTLAKLHRRSTLGTVEVNPFTWSVTAHDFKLMEPQGDPVFASFAALTVNLSSESLWRLAPVVQQLRLSKPYLHLIRTAAHHYNIDDLLASDSGKPPAQKPTRFSVNNIQVEGGRIEFQDRPEKASHAITGISLGVPFISSLPSQVNIFVEPLLSAQVDGTPLLIKGKARPFAPTRDAQVQLDLQDLDLTRYVGYLPFEPGFNLPSARLDARLNIRFQQPANKAPLLTVTGDGALKSVQLAEADGASILKLSELAVSLGNIDVFGGHVDLAKVVLSGLQAQASRDRAGQLSLLHLVPASGSPHATSAPASASTPFHMTLGELDVRNGTLNYTDEHAARPLRANVEKFDLALRKLAIDTARKTISIGDIASDNAGLLLHQGKALEPAANSGLPGAPGLPATPSSVPHAVSPAGGTEAAYSVHVNRIKLENWSARLEDLGREKPLVTWVAPLSLSIQDLSTGPAASAAPAHLVLKAGINKSGRLALDGSLGLAPFHAELAVDASNINILPLQPFIADKVNLRFSRGSLSGKGMLQLDAGQADVLKGGFKGNASLDNLATVDASSGDDFLRWQSLAFDRMDVRLAPFALDVENATLGNFFARVIIAPSGRINLQDIVRGESDVRKGLINSAAAGTAAGQAPAAATAAQKHKMPPIRIRKLTFRGGRVRFTDNFIRPNYSASLADLGGVVAGLSSEASATASVDLHGAVNDAPLSITGRINPLRQDLLLDLKARVNGMELAALSPYADKYIGYGIEKGKLSFEASYHVENRHLSAANRLILDQLTLSDKSTSAAANRLPVKLAIALLQDRNGIIDVNVPIQGSLDDPQFSIGGIVLKVIGNAIIKAVSQPFALLGSLFESHGNGKLSSLAFEPGRAAILPAAQAKLETLAKALADRPGLKLEITGWTDNEADYGGLKRAAIDRKVRALKRKDLLSGGQSAAYGHVVVSPDEYPALLKRVYKDEDFPKPRNLIGLPKSLPVKDMENLIMANTVIDAGDLTALANRRARVVKDWLLKFGHIPGERIFILASKSTGPEPKEGGANAVSSKVEFSLR